MPGISDAGKVNDFLYRGTQPNEEGIEQLKKLGINIIVDLRGERPGTIEKERKHSESLGMRLVNIPGNGWSPPRDEQVAQFFGSAQESVRVRILRGFLKDDEFGLGSGQALRLQQQVIEIAVAATTTQ
jgi:hypothetical protein